MVDRSTLFFVTTAVATSLALPRAVLASDVFSCQELKAAVADVGRGFAAHKGSPVAPVSAAALPGRTYQARKTMTGASICRVVEVSRDEPQMLTRQSGYSCQFPAVSGIDKALRARLSRCVSGEVDDASDPDEFTIWVDRVSSGEGYSATEVSAQINGADGLTLWVRQSVCTNKGDDQACED